MEQLQKTVKINAMGGNTLEGIFINVTGITKMIDLLTQFLFNPFEINLIFQI